MAAIGVVGTFAAVVYVVVPSGLHGGAAVSSAQPIEAEYEANQLLIESLAALIGHSADVIAVHPRTASPYMEIVLRLHGPEHAAEVPAEDIAVLSHSSVLHTIMLYTLEEQPERGRGETRSRSGRAFARPLMREQLVDPAFCAQWRSNPNVKPRLLARGLSDMQVQSVGDSEEGSSTLRLSLTWSPDSADGGDTAAVLVNAAEPRYGPIDRQP